MIMVQSNAHPMKPKLKGPPPVPPRPNQSVVAEALAKTRRAVADSKALPKPRTPPKQDHARSKTLDRSTQPSVSPKQNGLARVKSFIRDVISDRSSSSDERKSSGQNSRRSSSDSCSIPAPISVKKSNESLNSKAVKTCKQILSRSLSTSNKLDQDAKCKVTKSSSFAEKTLPLRRAPPPPLSPKPKSKLKPRPLPVHSNSLEKRRPKPPTPMESPYSSPVDAKPPKSPQPEAPYATVDEVKDFDDRLRSSPSKQVNDLPDKQTESAPVPHTPKRDETVNKNNNSLERKTSRVTEMLISEIIASRNNNKDEANSVIDKGKCSENDANGNDSPELERMKDMNNHDFLIYELQSMHSQSDVPETLQLLDNKEETSENSRCDSEDSEGNYAMSSVSGTDGDDGNDAAYAYIVDDDLKSRLRKQFKAISTMSLEGLPPLPKSLSGFADGEPSPELSPTEEKPPADFDGQLSYLKKEMDKPRSELLYVKDKKKSESDEDECDEDIWDDRKINDAYDKAIKVANAEVAKRLAMSTNSQPTGKEASRKKAKPSRTNVGNKPSSPWKVGMPCRAVYEEDGIEYEASIVRLVNPQECVVQFLGYDNRELVQIDSLKPSQGKEARTLQVEVAIAEQGGGTSQVAEPNAPSDSSFQRKKQSKKRKNQRMPAGHFELPNIRIPNLNFGSMDMPIPPPLPPPTAGVDTDDQALSSMLISWYMSGYYTGLYQGLRRGKGNRANS